MNFLKAANPYGIWTPTGEYVNPQQNNYPFVSSNGPEKGYINICLPMGNRPNGSYCCNLNGDGSQQTSMDQTSCPTGYGRIKCDRY